MTSTDVDSAASCASQPDDYDPQDFLHDLRYHLTFVDIEDFMHAVLLIPDDWRVVYGPVIKSVLEDEDFSAALKKYRWLSDIGDITEAGHVSFNNHALSALDAVEPVTGSDSTMPWGMKYVYRTLDAISDKRIKDRNGTLAWLDFCTLTTDDMHRHRSIHNPPASTG